MEDCENEVLKKVCGCPHLVHPTCMARWQVGQIGGDEEIKCRFCSKDLPDWRVSYAIPENVNICFNIKFRGENYTITPPEEYDDFQEYIKNTLRLKVNDSINIQYKGKSPFDLFTTIILSDNSQDKDIEMKRRLYRSAVHLAKYTKSLERKTEIVHNADSHASDSQEHQRRPGFFARMFCYS